MISGTCSQTASVEARKQAKPSEKTTLPGSTLSLAVPGLDSLACKPTHTIRLEENRPTFVVQLERRDKQNLILRLAASLASTELSAEVSIVNMDNSLQVVLTIPLPHRLH